MQNLESGCCKRRGSFDDSGGGQFRRWRWNEEGSGEQHEKKHERMTTNATREEGRESISTEIEGYEEDRRRGREYGILWSGMAELLTDGPPSERRRRRLLKRRNDDERSRLKQNNIGTRGYDSIGYSSESAKGPPIQGYPLLRVAPQIIILGAHSTAQHNTAQRSTAQARHNHNQIVGKARQGKVL